MDGVCIIPLVLSHTVEVAGVVLGLQLRYEFSFLPQETIPVETQKERVHLHFCRSS